MAHRRSLHGTPGQVGFPGFPVEGCGFEQLHVVLFEEKHISGTGESCEVGNPGTLASASRLLGMTKRRGLLKGKGPLLGGEDAFSIDTPLSSDSNHSCAKAKKSQALRMTFLW